jgi:predicted HAD superfamily hydrolase
MPVFQQLVSTGIVSENGLERLSSSLEGQLALSAVAIDFLDFKNEDVSSDTSIAELIGGFVLAPVAVEIAKWIEELASKLNVSVICFIGRDGWIPFNAFKRLYPSFAAIYLETSRNAQQSKHFRDYLGSKISGVKSVLIYDIGWRGSGLSLMQKEFDAINWYGSFLALVRQNRENEFTYLTHCRNNWLWAIENRDVLEILFSEDKESTIDYDETLKPIRSVTEKQNVQDFRKVVVNSAIKSLRSIKLEENYFNRLKILEMLCKYPSSKFASLFIDLTHRVNDSRIRPFVVYTLEDLLYLKDLSWWNGVKALRPSGKFKGIAWICLTEIQKFRYLFRRALLRLLSRTS